MRLHWNWFGASACGYTTLILQIPFPQVVADTQPGRSAAASRLPEAGPPVQARGLEGSGCAGSGRLVPERHEAKWCINKSSWLTSTFFHW